MKNRKIKTFPEKYGIQHSVLSEVKKLESEVKPWERDSKEFFEKLPYIGIAYLPWEYEYRDWRYDGESGDLFVKNKQFLKLKILEVSEKDVTFVHYDNHHHGIAHLKRCHEDFLLKGNEVVLKSKINEE